MRTMTRRAMLLVSLAPLALAACQTQSGGTTPTPSVTPAQIATYISLIAGTFQTALPGLNGLIKSPATQLNLATIVSDIQGLAGQFASTDTQSAQVPIVQRIASDVSGVVNALQGIPLPAAFETALVAVQALIPVVELAVGMILPNAAAAASMASMSPTEASAKLRRFIGSRGVSTQG